MTAVLPDAYRKLKRGDIVTLRDELTISQLMEDGVGNAMDGMDLEVTVPINIAQATLGSKIKVRTLDGKKVVLRIPPGTQPGTRFRIRGQGVEKGGRIGDLYVEVKLQVPEELSEESRRLMEALATDTDLRY